MNGTIQVPIMAVEQFPKLIMKVRLLHLKLDIQQANGQMMTIWA
jgi:hypothetical protein